MRKIIKLFLIVVLTVTIFSMNVYAASASIAVKVEISEDEVLLYIALDKFDNNGRGITGFVTDIEYDKSIFEEIKEEDMTLQNNWTDLLYNAQAGSIVILRNDFAKEEGKDIVIIKLHPKKDNIKNTKIILTSIQMTDAQNDIDIPDKEIAINFYGIDFVKIVVAIIGIVLILLFLRLLIRNSLKRRIKR